MAGGPMMGAPPVAKKNNTMLIVIIVIVVVVGLVVAGTLLVMNAFNNTVNSASDVSMTVAGTRTPTPSEYTDAPGSGMTYIQVTVSITNKADLPTAVSGAWFQIQASGVKYGSTLMLSRVSTDTTSASLPVGGTITFKVSFEIPSSATPQKIFYNPILGHGVSANI